MTKLHRLAVAAVLLLPGVTAVSSLQQPPSPVAAALSVAELRTEYAANPIGIDVRDPRLGWQVRAAARGVMQSAYQVQVASSKRALRDGKGLLWDSGVVKSAESVHVVYAGPAVRSGQRYFWRVRIWDSGGAASAWSLPADWEMGLLQASDWKASWIEPALPEDIKISGPSPLLRREFAVTGDVERARVYVTSHGLYEMSINGQRVGDAVLTPGWTSYNKRLQYQTYDVTPLLKRGPNAIGVALGNGWYRGNLAWDDKRNIYGDRLGLLMQIVVTYRGGRQETIGSDAGWKASTGPILMSEIYHGETYDARLEKPGWSSPGFADQDWGSVKVVEHRKDLLVAPAGPPVRRTGEIKPLKIFKTPAGDTVADMGQNMVGWVRLKVEGAAGTTVTLRHAEVLDKQGNFYVENLRAAKQTVRYTLRGGATEVYEPHFTFQGFRYVAIDGYPGPLTPDSLTGIVVHSDMTPAGTFETSKPLVNQLQHNIVWGQKGNFLDVPTDCPQRDERLGWMGDAQVFARTAASTWTWRASSRNGSATWRPTRSTPAACRTSSRTSSARQASRRQAPRPGRTRPSSSRGRCTCVTGTARILETQYPSMTAWVEYMRRRAGDDFIWSEDFTFGDWLAFASTASTTPGPPRQGPHRDGVFAHRPICAADRTRAGQGRRRREIRRHCSGGSRRRSSGSSSRAPGAWARTRRPPTPWRCSSTCCRNPCGRPPPAGWRARCGSAGTSRRGSSARRTCAMC